MVSEDENLMFIAFHIVAPSLKGLDNSQNFTIVSYIPSLCRNYLSR